MKKSILIVILALFTLGSFAQTKRIAYLSHSGTHLEYLLHEDDNLGLPADPDWLRKRQERRDSINSLKLRKEMLDSLRMADSIYRLQKGDTNRLKIEEGGPVKPPKERLKQWQEQKDTLKGKKPGEENTQKAQPEPKQQRLPGNTLWWLFALPAAFGFAFLLKK